MTTQHCSQACGRVFQISRFISVSDPPLSMRSRRFFQICAIGFVGGFSGVLFSGFGFFFSFGGGFGNARLDFSGGLSNGGVFSGFLDNFFFSFGGAVAFSFFAGVESLNLSNQSFQPAFGISGSFLGNAMAICYIFLSDKITQFSEFGMTTLHGRT